MSNFARWTAEHWNAVEHRFAFISIESKVINEITAWPERYPRVFSRGRSGDPHLARRRYMSNPEAIALGIMCHVRDVFAVGRDSRVRRPAGIGDSCDLQLVERHSRPSAVFRFGLTDKPVQAQDSCRAHDEQGRAD